ncbi:GNAT family N-acetyltransferase [Flavobacteriaceae bacterium]|nr:GNAT family N-acetyltransferase [Flavobacteriaceae bacterium]
MTSIKFHIIEKKDIINIIPLLSKLNQKTPIELLKSRVIEMSNQNYECIGIYDNQKLIGICGLWYMTRHYLGNSVEPDHVYINEEYRGRGIGKELFVFLENYLKTKGIEALELNTYTENRKSHKFYYNEGYEIYGYHFVKIIREDGKFY